MVVTFIFANSTKTLHKPVNFLIRWLDKSIAGHFAIGLQTDFSHTVFEAVAPRVRKITPYQEWLKYYTPVRTLSIAVPLDKYSSVLEWLEGMLGIRYGYEQIVFIAVCLIINPLNKLWNRVNLNYKKAVICTELGSRFIEKFLVYELKESHDKIGVRDMEKIITDLSKTEIKWQQTKQV